MMQKYPIPSGIRKKLQEDSFMLQCIHAGCSINMAIKTIKNKKCNWCKEKFQPRDSYEAKIKKFCSKECYWSSRRKRKKRKCNHCNKEFEYVACQIGRKFCSLSCSSESSKKSRKGSGNPNYKDGKASWNKYKKPSRSHYTVKHFAACRKYRKALVEEHGYPFCEVCKRSDRKTEVHHIYYASRYPRHKELHNFKNLILVCVQCHNDFHASKLKTEFMNLEQERGLKELFK